jgi:hypothetical protein
MSYPIGELLRMVGYISTEHLNDGLTRQRARPSKRLGEILVEAGYLTQERLEAVLLLQLKRTMETKFQAFSLMPSDYNREIRNRAIGSYPNLCARHR